MGRLTDKNILITGETAESDLPWRKNSIEREHASPFAA